jgi:uncharacterized protein YgiM (DUF1202 family)
MTREEATMDKQKKTTLEELMGTPEEREEMIREDAADEIVLDEPKRRTWLVILLSVLGALLLAAVGFVAWQSYSADKTLTAEEKVEKPATANPKDVPATTTEQVVYVNASDGLNMRQEPKSDSPVLALIPNGTKLVVLETSGDWYKVTFDSKTGWVAKLYTTDVNPLVYKNTNYGFEMTFPANWAYKFFPIKAEDGVTAAYYVALPTTDASIDESSMGIDKGYYSLFAITVYTPSQWDTARKAEGPKSTLLVQNAKYVVTYSTPNGIAATDLAARVAEVKAVLATIKFS